VHRHTARAHQRGADKETSEQQVGHKDVLHRSAESADSTFQQCLSGNELPTGKPFVQHKLQERAEQHGPEDAQAEFVASKGAVAKSPAPTPVEARSKPGPMIFRVAKTEKCSDFRIIISLVSLWICPKSNSTTLLQWRAAKIKLATISAAAFKYLNRILAYFHLHAK